MQQLQFLLVPSLLFLQFLSSVSFSFHFRSYGLNGFLVGFPLTIIGGIAGKRASETFYAPCRTRNFHREIPSIPWYRSLPCQMVMSGFLPFRFALFCLSEMFRVFQRNLHRVVLYLLQCMGTHNLSTVWNPLLGLHYSSGRDCMHYCCSYVLPTVHGRLEVVVEQFGDWGVNFSNRCKNFQMF
jgi:hypothetical protein